MDTIFHLRRAMRARRGNSFYRDRSERSVSTWCGGPVTEYDVASSKDLTFWVRSSDGRTFRPCGACKRRDS